jgi:hypothetical protein
LVRGNSVLIMKTNWFQPIPKNIDEAAGRLNDNLFPEDLNYLKTNGSVPFHNLGQRMRNEWLWDKKSILNKYFWDNYKIWHADDMSMIILDQLQANLNNKEFNLDEKVRNYYIYWESAMGITPGERPKDE